MTTSHTLILTQRDKVPAPRAGVEIVALGAGEPVALKGSRGLTLSERMFGTYKTFIEVDIAEKDYVEHARLPSQATTIFFDATVRVRYRVTNSAQIVKAGVNDGRVATWRLLDHVLQKSTRFASGKKLAEAEQLAEDAAEKVKNEVRESGELGLVISAVSVTLQLEQKTRELLETVEQEPLISGDIAAKQRLDEQRRKGDEEILNKGPRAWLAYLMRDNPNIIREVLNTMAVTEKERYDNDLKLLLKMLDSGEIESHEIPKNMKDDFIRNVLQRTSAGETLQLFQTNPKALPSQPDAGGGAG